MSLTERQRGFLVWAMKEVREVGWVVLYFFFCFGFFITLKKLLLEAYEIEFYGFTKAVIGALLAGKIVVVLDKTKAGTRLDTHYSIGAAALYKTIIYSAAAFLVLLAEEVFHAYRESGILGQAFLDVWTHEERHAFLAKVMCISLIFLGLHLFRGIDRRLGKGTLRRMVLSPP